MRIFHVLAMVVGITGLSSTELNAAVTLDIQDIVVTDNSGGSTVTASVFGNSLTGDSILTYNLPIEIGGDGRGLPTGFSNLSFTPVTAVNFSVNPNTLPSGPPTNFTQNYEAVINEAASGSPISFSTGPRELFQIMFDIDSSVATNVLFPISFTDGTTSDPNFFQLETANNGTSGSIADAALNGSVATPGSVTVAATAVPEPGSMLALGSLALGGLVARRRRR